MSPTREERVISLVVWDGRASTRTREECSEERLCKDDFGSLGRMDRMR